MIFIKSTGVVRRLDQLGRVVIPIEIRRILDFQEKDPLEIFTEGEQIIFRKYSPHCTLCEEVINLKQIKGKLFCKNCIEFIAEEGY